MKTVWNENWSDVELWLCVFSTSIKMAILGCYPFRCVLYLNERFNGRNVGIYHRRGRPNLFPMERKSRWSSLERPQGAAIRIAEDRGYPDIVLERPLELVIMLRLSDWSILVNTSHTDSTTTPHQHTKIQWNKRRKAWTIDPTHYCIRMVQ